ncbi:MAG TPA: acetyl-CoA carboxylase biotin carboxylase subunit [Ignavibacteria bacterium]|nr:acetyl-CoA carboxylase biotin carboxylase subunit [Ignavibacteria bacterium]
MFKKILIANRGEIAVRIIRACKELNIKSAAVYSEADKTSLHIRLADEAFLIGGAKSSESYLDGKKIIELAKKIGADAIHPGYGFFSENYSFIKNVEKEKIEFIGPSSKSVSLMGNKTAARTLMQKNNVPIVPGITTPIKTSKIGKLQAEEIGYPVLLKAVSGGGGIGMRVVYNSKEFDEALKSTKREAKSSFGSDEVYFEKFIENPKHIEVQILGDKHGNYIHLFERECSIQRRHQKIIEESPSSFVDEETRSRITEAAINAAKACKYQNAGTIEFLMDKDKNFYFLEMNTRLQVEHPVTELITGVDLVKQQIRIASGLKLNINQNDLSIHGHSLECRIYAEDPEDNFLPSTGKLTNFNIPAGPGIRVDTGFEDGSEISMYYDPLIAKLICWNNDRNSVISRMKRALDEFEITGVTHNINFLKLIMNNKKFIDGKFDINFIDKEKLLDKKLNIDSNEPITKETAAFIFSALMQNEKNQKISSYPDDNNSKNFWTEQIYE